jgi:hypothetical protein
MAYRDDFYINTNIIGYTGDINSPQAVTVYFESNTEFGHITQVHADPTNVGRGVVFNKSILVMAGGDKGTEEEWGACVAYGYKAENTRRFYVDTDGYTDVEHFYYERLQARGGSNGESGRIMWDHESRTELTPVSPATQGTLAQAIAANQNLKIYDQDLANQADLINRGSHAVRTPRID